MNPNSPPGPHTTCLDLAGGASRTFLLRAGANIVCLSGSLLIDAPRLAENGAPCPPLRLNAGEAQGVGHGGVLRITAIGAAQLVCLNPPGWLVRLGHLLRGGLALLTGVAARQKTGGGVDALHNISK